MRYLIKEGIIVSSQGQEKGDILIQDEKILQVGQGLSPGDEETEVIDGTGKYIFPGFIDTHTHFDLDAGDFHTADDFYTGTKAAVAGGTTTVLDFTTQEKGQTLKEALDAWHALADGKSSCDYGFHMSITDWNQEVRAELTDMTRLGVTSYKLYMTYDHLMVDDRRIMEILEAVEQEKGIIGVHCENHGIIARLIAREKGAGRGERILSHPRSRPAEAEAEAIHRLLVIAGLAGTPVNIVHLSTALGLQEVEAARRKGQQVFVETCPQYLALEESVYERPGFEGAAFVCSPPIRTRKDVDSLWQAVGQGRLDMLGTDHCSFHMASQKIQGLKDFTRIPNGLPGVEHRPVLFYSLGVVKERATVEEMCRLLSERPAKLFGMYPKKGAVAPGSDADLVIWDPDARWTIRAADQVQAADYTPYEGLEVQGRAATVFLRGEIVARDGKVCRERKGQYVSRGPRQV
ncbi:MAG: dihydropyrimidinase [Lachnospiraceae bacterium]|nr:dihydropyrimidinase [Lachnospiraceae bacterium]